MRQHEAAGMLRKMTRRADQLAGQFQGEAQAPIAEIEVQFLDVFGLDAFIRQPEFARKAFDQSRAVRAPCRHREEAFGAIAVTTEQSAA